MSRARANILGIGVSAVNLALALQQIDAWIQNHERRYVCVSGVHGVMESQHDPDLRRIHNQAGLVVPDGMPLVWLSRWQGFPQVGRVYGPDLMLAVCRQSLEKGYRHYLYGGNPGVPEILADELTRSFPGLQIVGMESPPFRPLTPDEDQQSSRQINAARPDIVWVGLSTPKQERWMAAHRDCLDAPVLIGVGAAFDFHAGLKRQAPPWMQKAGLEWFFRLATEPRRLWRRYLSNNPRFVLLVIAQALKLKKYTLDQT